MKNIILYLLVFSMALSSCGTPNCRNGDNGPTENLDGRLLTYFGKYRPNNLWIYENQSKSKVDSIFVGRFTDEIRPIDYWATSCSYKRSIGGILRNKFFGVSPTDELTNNYNYNFDINGLGIYKSDLGLMLSDGKLKIINPNGSLDTLLTFTLPSGKSYSNVWKVQNTTPTHNKTIYVAPEIGIVQFVTKNDTFNLIKFEMK